MSYLDVITKYKENWNCIFFSRNFRGSVKSDGNICEYILEDNLSG